MSLPLGDHLAPVGMLYLCQRGAGARADMEPLGISGPGLCPLGQQGGRTVPDEGEGTCRWRGASCYLPGRPRAFETREGASGAAATQRQAEAGLKLRMLRRIMTTGWQQRASYQMLQSQKGTCCKGGCLPAALKSRKGPQLRLSEETDTLQRGQDATPPGLGF